MIIQVSFKIVIKKLGEVIGYKKELYQISLLQFLVCYGFHLSAEFWWVVGRKASVMEKQYQKSRGVTSMNLSSKLSHQVYKISKHEAFILRNWGACVDTEFW